MNDWITLSKGEQRLVRGWARMRYELIRERGITDQLRSDEKGIENEINSFGAELAFCKYFNLYPDFSTEPHSAANGTDPGDCWFTSGESIDIKTTRYQNGRLLAMPTKAGSGTDFYALMTGSFPTYVFRGIMSGKELLLQERLGNLGRGEGYMATQEELTF